MMRRHRTTTTMMKMKTITTTTTTGRRENEIERSYTNLGVRSPFPSVFFYRAYSAPKLGALSGHLVIGQLRSHETNRRRVSDNNNTDC